MAAAAAAYPAHRERLNPWQDIACTLCNERHPIVEPVVLACKHLFENRPLHAVFNRVCLRNEIGRQLEQDLIVNGKYSSHPYCPTCYRAISVIRAEQFCPRHPLLQKASKYTEWRPGNWTIRALPPLGPTEESAESILSPDPLDRSHWETDNFRQRIAFKLTPFLEALKIPPENGSLAYAPEISADGSSLIESTNYGSHVFTLRLDRNNILEVIKVEPASWEEYYTYVREHSSLKKEMQTKVLPYVKTAIAVAACVGLYGFEMYAFGNRAEGLAGIVKATVKPILIGLASLPLYYLSRGVLRWLVP